MDLNLGFLLIQGGPEISNFEIRPNEVETSNLILINSQLSEIWTKNESK